MKLKWLGHACFELTLDNGKVLVTDPYDDSVGYPPLRVQCDAALSSHGHHDHNNFSFVKLLLIIIAFVAAYFTPGCPEIYPIF